MTSDTSKWMDSQDGKASDETLVRRAQGSPGTQVAREAISELFERYQAKVYQWCFRVVRNHEEALDMAQDAFLCAYRALPEFGERARFSSWLFVIARNRCLSALRGRRLRGVDALDPDAVVDGGPSPEDLVLNEMSERDLLNLIKTRLDPVEQEAIWLRCYERMPVDTITNILQIRTASGARGVLQSARRKLRAELGDAPGRDRGEDRP